MARSGSPYTQNISIKVGQAGSNAPLLRLGQCWWRAANVDHREQIILQGALNALPRNLSVATYRFRHVADRLALRGFLKVVETTPKSAQYSITPAGQNKLSSHRSSIAPTLPDIAAE
jgi:hypothetical protein